MLQNIYDPLAEYADQFAPRFQRVCSDTFAELAAEANIDVDANRKTCKELSSARSKINSTRSRIFWWKCLRFLSWLVVIIAVIYLIAQGKALDDATLLAICCGITSISAFLFLQIYPKIKQLGGEKSRLEKKAEELESEGWTQMEPLNSLYDWDIFSRMMSKTVPRLEFDPFFTTQRLADLSNSYGWDESLNMDCSVIYSHSGLINGNPFVICRTRRKRIGEKTYTGSLTINWTTRECGTDGNYHSVSHSQVLTATVTAPYPEYFEKTHLIYGNKAAPELVFSRIHSGIAGRENSFAYRKKLRALRRASRNLKHADFAMLTNEEFEVDFDTRDRNDNQQFALLFTPMAQQNILNLLRDRKWGYGDDFDFFKNRMINTVVAAHMQNMDMDMNPRQFADYDYDKAERKFKTLNEGYFRAVYFCMAPLLCVPMYQQIRPRSDIYGIDMPRHSCYWEHESLANFWGQEHFMDPRCVTDCILKTEQVRHGGDSSTITVHAYGYRVVERLSYVPTWGGDGRMHKVPVYWDEYLPVEGVGSVDIKEDNSEQNPSATQSERREHISKVLDDSKLSIYRRHIASSIRQT